MHTMGAYKRAPAHMPSRDTARIACLCVRVGWQIRIKVMAMEITHESHLNEIVKHCI